MERKEVAMSAKFAIRLAQIDDAQQITSLYSELDQYHARLLPTYFKELATARDSGIAAGLANKAEQIFVAESRRLSSSRASSRFSKE